MSRNIALYPWFMFFKNMLFWQALWFLYFQRELSAAEAILLYALFDVTMTVLEVPSGYFSDKVGRRITLVVSAGFAAVGAGMQFFGGDFLFFALANILLGASGAFLSGTNSALLYESLAAEGRTAEVEAQELRSFRFTFAGLAVSAIVGGVMALYDFRLAYAATTISFLAALVIALRFQNPPERRRESNAMGDVQALLTELRKPALLWLFGFASLTYGFSHLPFVFGQPFILDVLGPIGLAAEAPLVAGGVITLMMLLSLAASLAVGPVRRHVGIATILVLAFAVQVGISAAMAVSGSVAIIAILLLRMVPNAFINALTMARVQLIIGDQMRATYVSIQSLVARLAFSATLAIAAGGTPDTDQMARADIQSILGWYAVAGMVFVALLALTARRANLGGPEQAHSA